MAGKGEISPAIAAIVIIVVILLVVGIYMMIQKNSFKPGVVPNNPTTRVVPVERSPVSWAFASRSGFNTWMLQRNS